ncbi:uncharacterized protein [Drosophila bipectinata]|uniref:uncharacterized protein n=1 Tax=Drosophila bipectinata TaxID=42026 RepID=UPI0038B242E4
MENICKANEIRSIAFAFQSVGLQSESNFGGRAMTSILLAVLSTICTGMSNYVKAKLPFIVEAAMVVLCFASIVGRYCIVL